MLFFSAVVHRFSKRDLVDLASIEAGKFFNVFRMEDGHSEETTALAFGTSLLSPELTDGAGRRHRVSGVYRIPIN